jgi:class 3 adenylate cyclase
MINTYKERFHDLLYRYSSEPNPAARDELEATLWKEFGADKVVLVLDMSGFSQLSQRHGIVHYLSMVRRMQLTAEPVIESHGGVVVKFEADNCFGMFDDSLSAVRCGISLNHAFDAANLVTPVELDIHISVGIDRGKVLVVDNYLEFFGNAVNCASKLGEDGARPGEVLVTKEVAATIPAAADIDMKPLKLSLSGLEIEGYVVQYRKTPSAK